MLFTTRNNFVGLMNFYLLGLNYCYYDIKMDLEQSVDFYILLAIDDVIVIRSLILILFYMLFAWAGK